MAKLQQTIMTAVKVLSTSYISSSLIGFKYKNIMRKEEEEKTGIGE